MKIGTSLPQFC